jgi:hypothetical protein
MSMPSLLSMLLMERVGTIGTKGSMWNRIVRSFRPRWLLYLRGGFVVA